MSSVEKFTMVEIKLSLMMTPRMVLQSAACSPSNKQMDSKASLTAGGGLPMERTSTRCCFLIDFTAVTEKNIKLILFPKANLRALYKVGIDLFHYFMFTLLSLHSSLWSSFFFFFFFCIYAILTRIRGQINMNTIKRLTNAWKRSKSSEGEKLKSKVTISASQTKISLKCLSPLFVTH